MKILAKKVDMTQIFDVSGRVSPVTRVVLPIAKDSATTPVLDLALGDTVTVSGISKGRGFQGVVKRHGFHGGPRSHGQKHSEREAGSIGGAGRAGGRVAKGMRMAGRMGGDKVTVKNLKVIKVVPESGEIYISGALPGRRGTVIEVRKQVS